MVGLSCPRCEHALNKQADGKFACSACAVNFPTLKTASGSVPFVWPEPGAALLDWRNRFNAALADIEAQIADTKQVDAALPASVKARIKHLHAAWQRHYQELGEALAPLSVGEALAKETHLALRTRLPSHHGVLSYAQNIHRDWCWGDDENRQVIDHLSSALENSEAPQSILVLGCGAGRLAYDLHHTLQPRETLALDSNPLLCLLGQRLSQGEKVAFTEFPLAPISAEDSAVERTLSAPEQTNGITFVCADALRLPFAPGTFDLVVTPWLIDVVDADLGALLRVVHRVLRPGGTWLNHGSLAFAGGHSANRLSREDLLELTADAGFEVARSEDVQLPYLQSPASRQQRSELTYTQVARRDATAVDKQAKRHQHLPEWIVGGRQAVPLSNQFQTQINTTRIHAFIMSLIDGKRSIQDMAQVLEEQRLMPANQASQAIRQFLTTMYEEATRHDGRAAGTNELD